MYLSITQSSSAMMGDYKWHFLNLSRQLSSYIDRLLSPGIIDLFGDFPPGLNQSEAPSSRAQGRSLGILFLCDLSLKYLGCLSRSLMTLHTKHHQNKSESLFFFFQLFISLFNMCMVLFPIKCICYVHWRGQIIDSVKTLNMVFAWNGNWFHQIWITLVSFHPLKAFCSEHLTVKTYCCKNKALHLCLYFTGSGVACHTICHSGNDRCFQLQPAQ